MAKQVRKIRHAQSDILSEEAIAALIEAETKFRSVLEDTSRQSELEGAIKELETTANHHLRSYKHPVIRENVEVVLVAVAVALGVRTFFLQPFKIPTGSMQPTLWGITVKSEHEPGVEVDIPNGLRRVYDRWARGISYHHLVAKSSGVLRVAPPKTVIPFLLTKQTLWVGETPHHLWNPPKNLSQNMNFQNVSGFLQRAGLRNGLRIREGDDLLKTATQRGDYLFVDRISYNFRRPKRGEIIVFSTKDIKGIGRDDQFYIKRLVGLGGETLRLANNRKLEIDGEFLTTEDKGFEKVYSFDPSREPAPHDLTGIYSGHVNGYISNLATPGFRINMTYFKNDADRETISEKRYMVMGDNTMNSSDSRYWGDFPRENVIGKLAFTYWPFDRRRL